MASPTPGAVSGSLEGSVGGRRRRPTWAAYTGGNRIGGMGGLGLPVGGGAGIVLLLIVLAFQFCGGGGLGIPGDPLDDLGAAPSPAGLSGPDPDAKLIDFVDAVFDDIQIMWEQDIFAQAGRRHMDPALHQR
jgi:predicted metalloprotease